jgi:cobalt/nickel transport system permease protein
MRLGCAHALESAGLAGDPTSPVHRLDARAKLLGLVGLTLVAATAPRSAWPLPAACMTLLGAVAIAARVPAGLLWRRARVILPLVALAAVSVPFMRQGGAVHQLGPLRVSDTGLAVFGAAIGKATVGTLSALLLAATTSVSSALEGLRRLRAPAALVAIAGVTWRYVFVLAGEAGRMRTALAARGHRPRHLLQVAATGRLATALFLRAHARGERVHVAMAARGWTGLPPAMASGALGRADLLFVTALVGAPLALRLVLEVGA